MYLSTHKDPGITNRCTWPTLKDMLYMSTTHNSQIKIMTAVSSYTWPVTSVVL